MRLGRFLAVVLVSLVAMISASQETFWRWDQGVYDMLLPTLFAPAPDDVVIVAIDEFSLEELGQWPWPRRSHAELIERLTSGGAEFIAFDILFAEPDRVDPDNDSLLAAAIERAGNVALPLANGQRQADGVLMEVLPLPPLATSARTLGHTDIPLDADDVARQVYLRAGLGGPHWSHLALAVLEAMGSRPLDELKTVRRTNGAPVSPLVWIRDHEIRIPFTGPPGHFRQVSYADVIAGRFADDAFLDKIVIVGATASGLGDFLPTPVSGDSHPMAGVEIIANLLQGLRNQTTITSLPLPWRYPLSIVLVAVPLVLMTRVRPQGALAIVLLFALLPLGISFVLLHGAGMWFPPIASMFLVISTYLLWTTARLVEMLRALNLEIDQLRRAPAVFPEVDKPTLSGAALFLSHYMPLRGLIVTDGSGNKVERWGVEQKTLTQAPSHGAWVKSGHSYWTTVGKGGHTHHIGFFWDSSTPANPKDLERLGEIAQRCYGKPPPRPRGPVEFLRSRVERLQTATSRLRAANRFIGETVSQAASGVLVIDNFGITRLANERAALLLTGDPGTVLQGEPAETCLQRLHFPSSLPREKALRDVYLNDHPLTVEVDAPNNRRVLVTISAFSDASELHLNGIIVQLVDITPLKEAERQRQDMLSFLSHDFRSPLASIQSIMEAFRMRPESFDTSKAHRIDLLARNALELADNLLFIMRDEAAAPPSQYRIDLALISRFAVLQVEPQAAAKGIELKLAHRDDELWITGNEHLLERVFTNLLSNAVKYSPEGATVRVSTWREGKIARAAVADTGHGIPPEELPHLFDRYRSFRRQGQSGGTGLGLAFVSLVVAQHDGRITVNSEPGQGTTFDLYFPALADDVHL